MTANKRVGLLVLLVVVLVIVYVSGRSDAPDPDSLVADLHGGEIAVFKLSMRDGTTGEAVSTGETELIGQFTALMQTVTFTEMGGQEQILGWSYCVDLHTMDEGYQRITFLGGQTVHFSAVDPEGRYLVKDSPYYEIDRNLSAELERLYISLEREEAGEGGGSENIHLHYNIQLATNACARPT